MALVTDSNRPQPSGQPAPTADLTASGAASDVPSFLMRPCPPAAEEPKASHRGAPPADYSMLKRYSTPKAANTSSGCFTNTSNRIMSQLLTTHAVTFVLLPVSW